MQCKTIPIKFSFFVNGNFNNGRLSFLFIKKKVNGNKFNTYGRT